MHVVTHWLYFAYSVYHVYSAYCSYFAYSAFYLCNSYLVARQPGYKLSSDEDDISRGTTDGPADSDPLPQIGQPICEAAHIAAAPAGIRLF